MTVDRPVDLAILGGRIATMDPARSWASALAVRDGRIVAVGSDQAIRPQIGLRTRVIEARGRTVTPGFGDAHVHPVHAGVDNLRCQLRGARGIPAYLDVIATYATTHPEVPWIRGGGWSMDDFPGGIPTRVDLDRVVPDRPAILYSRDGHTAWVNSRALELAGVTKETNDPEDGRIDRDPDGNPIGALQEGAADLVQRLVPATTRDELVAGLRQAQAELHSLGITNWQDAIVEPANEEVAYVELAGRGELSARVVGALWWERSRGAEQIEELVERRTRTTSNRYRATSVKIMQDGVVENFTAGVLEPYLDKEGRPTDNRGLSQVDPEALKGYVATLDELGFQPHFHALAERAVREALDAVDAARRANGLSDTRPHIAHIQVIHPDDIGRFRELNVVANAQPLWAVQEGQMTNLTIPFLGPERSTWQYPFRSLLAAGATLAMGSDWSVSTADPLMEMEVAVQRTGVYGVDYPVFLPEQRLDLMDALAGFTAGTAWVNHLEHELGSIEVGKTGDFVILDRDLFDRGAGKIRESRVIGTFIDGTPVFEASALDT